MDSEELHRTNIDVLNPFSSKSMTLILRGGLWTFLANLALCVPVRPSTIFSWDQKRNQRKLEYACIYLFVFLVTSCYMQFNHFYCISSYSFYRNYPFIKFRNCKKFQIVVAMQYYISWNFVTQKAWTMSQLFFWTRTNSRWHNQDRVM